MKGAIAMLSQKSELALWIEQAFTHNEHLDDSQIEVLDDNGVITLTGVASSNEARMVAAEIVQSAPGVISLTNDLEVRGINDSDGSGSGDTAVPIIPVPLGRGTGGNWGNQ
jgi:hypothetical protein